MQQTIAGIEARLTTVEQTPQAQNVEGVTDGTATVAPATTKNVSKLIIKGLVYNPTAAEEAEDTLKASVLGCSQATGVDIELIAVQHVERTHSGPDIKPIIAQLLNEEVKSTILRDKAKLSEIEPYKTVYIEGDRSCQERLRDANMRRIVNALPDLNYRRGLVQPAPAAVNNN